jgi:photosystem II stability/assembly factor-like uncharacterized protein
MSGQRHTLQAVSLLTVAAGAAMGQTWTELGPAPIASSQYSGRISAVACSRTDPDRYYVGAADGGVWRTIDGGQTWTPITDQMPTTAIGAIAVDPTDDRVVYVGSGEGNFANHSRYGLGVYKTTDGGDTWNVLAAGTFSGRCFSKIAVNPQTTNVLYAAVCIAGGFPSMAAAKNHPQRNDPVGIFKSVNGGVTWARLTAGLPNLSATDLALNPANPSVLYAGIGHIFGSPDNGVYKSTDAGATWTKLSSGLPTATLGRVSLAVAPSQPSRVYAFFAQPSDAGGGSSGAMGFYRSDNDGGDWSLLSTGASSSYNWYFGVVGVHPTNPAIACNAALDLAWVGASLGTPAHVDQHSIAWDAAGRIVAGCDGGVFRNPGSGGTWFPLNNGLGAMQFYAGLSTHPSDAERMVGGLQDNGSVRRTAPGLSWGSISGGDGGWTQLDQTNPSIIFTESQGTAALYRSVNGGNSFNNAGGGITGRNCFLPPYVIDPNNPNRVLYGTERVWQSLTGGVSGSWTAISPDLTASTSAAIRSLAIAPTNSQVVYAATNNGRVLVSTDGGVSFTLIASDAAGWPRTTRELFVDPRNEGTLYLAGAVFGVDHVRRTKDFGQSWQTLDGDLPDIPVNTIAADTRCGRPILYAGTDIGVYRSTDDGVTWSRYGQGLPNAQVVDIRLEPWRDRMVVATMGRGAWSAPVHRAIDMNDDGNVNLADFGAFQTAFALGRLRADFNGDGALNLADFGAFQTAFALGCQ